MTPNHPETPSAGLHHKHCILAARHRPAPAQQFSSHLRGKKRAAARVGARSWARSGARHEQSVVIAQSASAAARHRQEWLRASRHWHWVGTRTGTICNHRTTIFSNLKVPGVDSNGAGERNDATHFHCTGRTRLLMLNVFYGILNPQPKTS